MKHEIVIGSRESRLAMIQTEMIRDEILAGNADLKVRILPMKTTGDRILDRRLDEIGGKGLFVKELDLALREGRTDLSVHSCKDLPTDLPADLPVICYSRREDVRDVLVLPEGQSQPDLSLPIGTSSARRLQQAKALLPGARFESVRGNLQTRLRKLDEGQYAGLILAAAGLKRLGLSHRISRYFSVDEMIPAAGQGVLAVQGRAGEDYACLAACADAHSALAVHCERAFVRALEGDCSAPIGAYACRETDGTLRLRGLYVDPETGVCVRGEERAMAEDVKESEALGIALAQRLKAQAGRPAGKVWLVGAGPGDAGLLTLKGAQVLSEAEVVVYDALVGEGVLAMIPREAEHINVGKRSGNHTMRQEEINRVLLEKALEGRRVVRLKGGDPFLFGRGGEELELLAAHQVPYEVVPGITSAFAVPAYNGIPVTHRAFTSSVHVITGHRKAETETPIDYEALVRTGGTLIFLMGLAAMEGICEGLLQAGMDPEMPAAVLSKGTTAGQQRVVASLRALPEQVRRSQLEAPAIIVVGRVCSLADTFGWAEQLPLFGCRVLVTRPKELISGMADKLRRAGAQVLELPAIRTVPIRDNEPLKESLQALAEHAYDWLVFTSQTGVKIFFDALFAAYDIRILAGVKVAAIGKSTRKALAGYGIRTDLMPPVFDAGQLGEALAKACREGERLLIPRSAIGSKALLEALERRPDLTVCDLPTYDTVYECSDVVDERGALERGEIDLAVFTSASTVRGLVNAVGEMDYTKIRAVCIGAQTAAQAQEAGMQTVIAKEATMDAVVEAVMEAARREGAQER